MQYAFHFNVDRCAECFACEVACKAEHDLPPRAQEAPGSRGPRYRQVVQLKDEDAAGCPLQYVSMACMHCGSADCMAVCPAKAIYRDVFVKTVVSWVARKTFRPGTARFYVRQGMPLNAFS